MLANEGAGEATWHSASQNWVSPGNSKSQNSIAAPLGQVKPVLNVSPLFPRIFQPAQLADQDEPRGKPCHGKQAESISIRHINIALAVGLEQMQSYFKPEGDQFGPLARGTKYAITSRGTDLPGFHRRSGCRIAWRSPRARWRQRSATQVSFNW
jgi:hypothetical protein